MHWGRFGVTAAYALILFLFYLVTQLGYWSLTSSTLAMYTTILGLAGLVVIMAFLASSE